MAHDPGIKTFLQRDGIEGRKRTPYRCTSGKWSIGIGRNLEDNPLTLDELLLCLKDGISDEAVDALYDQDESRAFFDLRRVFPSFDGWPPARQCAVISVYHTTGLAGFLKFRDMVAALHEGRWADAGRALLDSKRSRVTLARSPRDEEEARMIETGQWEAREGRIV